MNFDNFWKEFELYCKSFSYNIVDTKFLGILSHPIINNNIYLDDNQQMKQITQKNFDEVIEFLLNKHKENMKDKNDLDKFKYLIMMINKPYRIEVFTMFQHLLPDKDYNEILSFIWKSTEFPHQINIIILNKLFKKIRPELFMDKDDLKIYNDLPKTITIYRGLQGSKAKVRVLSWSLSYEKALWFTKRFDLNGKVYKTQISKKDIYAYDNSMGEEEIIVNPFKLKNFEEIIPNNTNKK